MHEAHTDKTKNMKQTTRVRTNSIFYISRTISADFAEEIFFSGLRQNIFSLSKPRYNGKEKMGGNLNQLHSKIYKPKKFKENYDKQRYALTTNLTKDREKKK